MRERDAHRTSSTNPPDRCEECKSNPAKYKCPGCSIRSCSLPCVKAHKHRTGCTGKKNATTQFVSLSQFDDTLLLSDFKFLEGAKRVSESAKRLRSKLFRYEAAHFTSRRTRLLMRAKNQSRYCSREKTIFFEWRFHSTDVVLNDHGVNENMSLCSIIQNHLKPSPWNHQLRKFCEVQLDHLKLFIRENSKFLKSSYRLLDMKAPLRVQLANLRILEYPVIYVFLPSHDINIEVVQGANAFVRHVCLLIATKSHMVFHLERRKSMKQPACQRNLRFWNSESMYTQRFECGVKFSFPCHWSRRASSLLSKQLLSVELVRRAVGLDMLFHWRSCCWCWFLILSSQPK